MNNLSAEAIIKILLEANLGSREIDGQVGLFMGYVRSTDPSHPKHSWIFPSGKIARLPQFSTSAQDAYELARSIELNGGCSWETGMGSARIGAGPFAQAASPALALCVAIVNHGPKR